MTYVDLDPTSTARCKSSSTTASGAIRVELQQRATPMALDARKDAEAARGAIKRSPTNWGPPEALRNWVREAEIDGGVRPGTTTDDAPRLAGLEREVRELRRANDILKTSAGFFAAAELDRKIK